MNPKVKQDIERVLREAIGALEDHDLSRLYELSNNTIHNSSIFQDEDSLQMAVLIYSVSKIFKRRGEGKKLSKMLSYAHLSLKESDFEGYKKAIGKLFDFINRTDDNIGLYVMKVINEAKIKKGSKIYDHGISLSRASNMLGISQWELMNYVGKTNLKEQSSKGIIERLRIARGLFTR